jgi:hypothetical protein
MRRLILKSFLFLSLVAGTFIFPAWVLAVSREWTPVNDLMKNHLSGKPALIGLAYSDPEEYFKLEAARSRRAEVLALGNSRVMQFRSEFVKDSFYNAAFGNAGIADLRTFFRHLSPQEKPKFLILGLDQVTFNPHHQFPPKAEDKFKEPDPRTYQVRMLIHQWDQIYRDWFKHKFRIADLVRPGSDGVQRIGLSAVVRDEGFRNDGSYQWHRRDDNDLQWIANKDWEYVPADTVSAEALSNLEALLSECKQRGVVVAAFLTPYSPSVYHALEEKKGDYAWVFALSDKLRPLFERYGFIFADFTDPALLEADETKFLDGRHTKDGVYAKLWSLWTDREPTLKALRSA